MNDGSKTVERRFQLAAIFCTVLLIVNYFALRRHALGTSIRPRRVPWPQNVGSGNYHVRFSHPQARQKADAFSWGSGHARYRGYAPLYPCWCRCGSRIWMRSGGRCCPKTRAPMHVLVPNDAMLDSGFQTNTYPSGHTTVVTSLALSLLLVSPSRWRPWLAIAGGCISATVATGVLFVGAHRPSDALGALAWSGLCMNVAAAFVVRLQGHHRPGHAFPNRAAFDRIAFGILVVAAIGLFSAAAAPA
jgi:membrane-associated phospholipid phosphatase